MLVNIPYMDAMGTGVHHKNLFTWENRAPKNWQVASPLVMYGFFPIV